MTIRNPLIILDMSEEEAKRFQTLRLTEMANQTKCEETLHKLGFSSDAAEKSDISFLLDLIERAVKHNIR